MLGEIILHHADNLSSTLQHKAMSAVEGQAVARMTVKTIRQVNTQCEAFDLFWEKVCQRAAALEISGPQLSRCRKVPRRYDDGVSSGDHHESPKTPYTGSTTYYEVIDLVINSILKTVLISLATECITTWNLFC